MNFRHRKPIKRTCHRQRIRAHIFKNNPIAQLQLRQQNILEHVIQTVASRPPHTAGVQLRVRILLQGLRLHVLMVVEDAIEAAVNAVVDVVHVVFGGDVGFCGDRAD